MGNTWEVYIWGKTPYGDYRFGWQDAYAGESAIAALLTAWKMKRQGSAVKIEWR